MRRCVVSLLFFFLLLFCFLSFFFFFFFFFFFVFRCPRKAALRDCSFSRLTSFLFVIYVFRDAVLTSSVNCFTSFLAGFAVFSVLGHMAKMQGTDVDKVSRDGKRINFSKLILENHSFLIRTKT